MQGYQAKIKEMFKNIHTWEKPYETKSIGKMAKTLT